MRALLALSLLLLWTGSQADAVAESGSTSEAEQRWNFRVLLDGKEIGTHDFTLRDAGNSRQLTSVAAFDVKFLFFTAYKYRHRNIEQWRDDCLVEMDAETTTNGDTIEVSGERREDVFVVESTKTSNELPGCVMTFAYWNPAFMENERLLNPQTGEFLDVEVGEGQAETINVRGESRDAERFDVTAKDMQLKLWYSSSDEWLALESVVKGGRIIRYELI